MKGERCFTPKCAVARKPYVPGPATKSGKTRRASTTEYGIKLREKQKIKFSYGLRTRQYDNYTKEAESKAGGGNVMAALTVFLNRDWTMSFFEWVWPTLDQSPGRL